MRRDRRRSRTVLLTAAVYAYKKKKTSSTQVVFSSKIRYITRPFMIRPFYDDNFAGKHIWNNSREK